MAYHRPVCSQGPGDTESDGPGSPHSDLPHLAAESDTEQGLSSRRGQGKGGRGVPAPGSRVTRHFPPLPSIPINP